jgi:hypothetical protein
MAIKNELAADKFPIQVQLVSIAKTKESSSSSSCQRPTKSLFSIKNEVGAVIILIKYATS